MINIALGKSYWILALQLKKLNTSHKIYVYNANNCKLVITTAKWKIRISVIIWSFSHYLDYTLVFIHMHLSLELELD